MHDLIVPRRVYAAIKDVVDSSDGMVETGVKLFGTRIRKAKAKHSAAFVVLTICGPGEHAHHSLAHYCGDEIYASAVYEALLCAMPNLSWLGELHVHPQGMTSLSAYDLETVAKILSGADEGALQPPEFVAGVMQRETAGPVLYPVYFAPECLAGEPMRLVLSEDNAVPVRQARRKGVEENGSRICQKSAGGRAVVGQTSRRGRLRQRGQRHRLDGR